MLLQTYMHVTMKIDLVLTSSGERQNVSSKNIVDDMTDAITGGNDIGLWALWLANIEEKNGNIG